MPVRNSFSMNLSDTSGRKPNLDAGVVSVSLVWESNAGLTTVALRNRNIASLRCCGLTFLAAAPAAPRLLPACSISFFAIWPAMWSTCRPPRSVQIPFTNETCWNSFVVAWPPVKANPPVKATATSQPSAPSILSYTRGQASIASLPPTYRSTYFSMDLYSSLVPLK